MEKRRPIPIDEMDVHPGPHPDDRCGLEMLWREGESFFPGISRATVRSIDPREIQLPPDSAAAWRMIARKRSLPVGVGDNAPYNDHSANGSRPKKSAAELVAEDLGLRDDPRWQPLVDYLGENDRKGKDLTFGIARFIKVMKRMPQLSDGDIQKTLALIVDAEVGLVPLAESPDEFFTLVAEWLKARYSTAECEGNDPLKVASRLGVSGPALQPLLERIGELRKGAQLERFEVAGLSARIVASQRQEWTFRLLDAFRYEREMLLKADALLTREGDLVHGGGEMLTRQRLRGVDGKKLGLLVAETRNPFFLKRACYRNPGIVVHRDLRTGHVQIIADKQLDLDMRDAVRCLRILEMAKLDPQRVVAWDVAEAMGAFADWYYDHRSHWIMRGSESSPNTPPTNLTLSQIVWCVQTAFGLEAFPEKVLGTERAARCLQRICTSTRRNPCPWRDLGLIRCRRIRARAQSAACQRT